MKKIIIIAIGILIEFNSFGQGLTVKMEIDTLKIIRTENIPTKEISIGIPYGIVYVSKASLFEKWDNELALWDAEFEKKSRNKEWQVENYKQSELYLEFVKREDKLFFEYVNSDYALVSRIPQIEEQGSEKDTLFCIENQLKKIVCNLLDIGEFEVQIQNKKVNKVVKAKVKRTLKYSETITIEYIVNDTIHFWICPPIIHSDFATDEE